MRELLRTNDAVLLSYLQALFADAGIAAVVLDSHSAIMQGSAGAIPRRVMVAEADFAAAQELLDDVRRAHPG